MKMCYSSLRFLFSITVLNLLVVQHDCRTIKRSSAPIRKSSGLQWSAPKSKGSGNVSIVILPQENSINNSDFVVAINTDYKVLSEDTHLLSLMMNDSNTVPEKNFQSIPLQFSNEVESTDMPHKKYITKCSFKGTNTRYKPYTKLIQIPVKYDIKNRDKIISGGNQDDVISENKVYNELHASNRKFHTAQYYDPNIKDRRTSGKFSSSTDQVSTTTSDFINISSNIKATKLFKSASSLKDKNVKTNVVNSNVQKPTKISVALEMLKSPENENIHFQNFNQIPDVHIEKIRPEQIIKVYPYQNFTIGMNKSLKPSDLAGTLNTTKRLRFVDRNVEAINEHNVQDNMSAKFSIDGEDTFTNENHPNFDVVNSNSNNQNTLEDKTQFFHPLLYEDADGESATQEVNEYQSSEHPCTPSYTSDTFINTKQKNSDQFKHRVNVKQENLNSVKVQEITSPVLKIIDSIDVPESQKTILNNKPQCSNRDVYDIVLVIPPVPNQLCESKHSITDETQYLLNTDEQETIKHPNKVPDFVRQRPNGEEFNDSLNKSVAFVSYNISSDDSTINTDSGESSASIQSQTGNILNRTSINLIITNNDSALYMLNENVPVKGQTSNTYKRDGSTLKEQKPSLTINFYNKNNSNK